MKGILAIYRREMGSYFVSPIAYIVVGFFLLVAGYFFYVYLANIMQRAMMMQMQQMSQEMDVPGLVIRYFFGAVSFIILFMIPMLTMGIYAEERKRGTMELPINSSPTNTTISTRNALYPHYIS